MNESIASGINWKRGMLRLWILASMIWCTGVFLVELTNAKVAWFPATSRTIHVEISKKWVRPKSQSEPSSLEDKLTDDFNRNIIDQFYPLQRRETWDYPAELGVRQISDELQKRVVAEDAKDREWAVKVPTARKAECNAIPQDAPFAAQPADCVRLFFANGFRSVLPGWESSIETGTVSAWTAIVRAMPQAIGPPVIVLGLGASLFWVFSGFRLGSR